MRHRRSRRNRRHRRNRRYRRNRGNRGSRRSMTRGNQGPQCSTLVPVVGRWPVATSGSRALPRAGARRVAAGHRLAPGSQRGILGMVLVLLLIVVIARVPITPRCRMFGTMDCREDQEEARGESHTNAGAWGASGKRGPHLGPFGGGSRDPHNPPRHHLHHLPGQAVTDRLPTRSHLMNSSL